MSKPPAKSMPRQFSVIMCEGYESLGCNEGDRLTAEKARDIRPGEIVLFSCPCTGRKNCYLSRCALVTEQTYYFTMLDGKQHRHDLATLTFLGRVVEFTRRIPPKIEPIAEGQPQWRERSSTCHVGVHPGVI